MANPITRLFNRIFPTPVQTPPAQIPPVQAQRVLFTRGDDAYTPPAYRNLLELEFRRALAGASSISDDALTQAARVSLVAMICINYRAQNIGHVPIACTEQDGYHPFAYFMGYADQFMGDVDRALSIWGRAYALKQRNQAGFPTGLKWLNPSIVVPTVHGQRVVGYYLSDTHERVAVEDIVEWSLFDPDPDGNGLSRLEMAFKVNSIESNVATYAASFFFNSALPDGMITFEGVNDEATLDIAKRMWQKGFRGAENAHKLAMMPSNAKWQPITQPPKDLAMVELSDDAKQKVCAAFGVPPALVGLGDVSEPLSASNTLKEARRGFYEMTIVPDLDDYLGDLNNQWALIDFEPTNTYRLYSMPEDLPFYSDVNSDNVQTASNAVTSGVLDYDEARLTLGYGERDPQEHYYVKRDTTQPLSLLNAGVISMNEMRRMSGLQPDRALIDLHVIGGIPIPKSQLQTYWQNQPSGGLIDAPMSIPEPNITIEPVADTPALPSAMPNVPQLPSTTQSTYDYTKELTIWRRMCIKKGRDYAFVPDALMTHPVLSVVRWGLAQDADVDDLFETARAMVRGDIPMLTLVNDEPVNDSAWLALRSMGLPIRSQQSYLQSLRALFRGHWSGALDAFAFTDDMNSAITRNLLQAAREGLEREGRTLAELEPDERALIDDEINTEISHIPGVQRAIAENSKANGGQVTPLLSRAALWATAYDGMVHMALLIGAGNKKKIWNSFNDESTCVDCRKLNGRVYSARTWLRAMLRPQGRNLRCAGNCRCKLNDTDAPLTPGRPPRIVGRSHQGHMHHAHD